MRPKYLIESEIAVRKQWLAETDYLAIKFAEGVLTEDDFAKSKEQRATWRSEINDLETELAEYSDESEE